MSKIRSKSLEIMRFQRYKAYPDRAEVRLTVKSVRPSCIRPHLPSADHVNHRSQLWMFGGGFFLPLCATNGNVAKRRVLVNPHRPLVAPYCAMPRDYLSDTPLLRAMGFLVSQHGQLGAVPPPPFLSVSPLESMRSGGAPPSEGVSQRYWRDTL